MLSAIFQAERKSSQIEAQKYKKNIKEQQNIKYLDDNYWILTMQMKIMFSFI